jgi:hypothetical protein
MLVHLTLCQLRYSNLNPGELWSEQGLFGENILRVFGVRAGLKSRYMISRANADFWLQAEPTYARRATLTQFPGNGERSVLKVRIS